MLYLLIKNRPKFTKNISLTLFASLIFSLVSPFIVFAEDCESSIGRIPFTKLLSEEIVRKQESEKSADYHPRDTIIENQERAKLWNRPPYIKTPSMLQFLLPDGVHPINHSLPYSPSPTIVRLPEPGVAIIARASYPYKDETFWTNVIFNRAALYDNFHSNSPHHKWLVGPSAKAAVLFLHGGGTRTATSSNFTEEIGHISRFGMDGIAIDLPVHGNGSTEIRSLKEHVLAISEFTKKYIPPNVPLFVYGHSFGGAFAEIIMQMSDNKDNPFHPSLQGVIIASAPIHNSKLPTRKMLKDYNRRINIARKKTNQLVLPENNIIHNLIQNNKISLLNSLFTSVGLHEVDYSFPAHKGDQYLPTLFLMGKYDQLVYLGFENLFKQYYDRLTNVKTIYFDKEKTLGNEDDPVMVGHLLANYINKETSHPIHLQETVAFILETLNNKTNSKISLEELKKHNNRHEKNNYIIQIAQLWSNDLSFRNWFDHIYFEEHKKFGIVKQKNINKQRQITEEINQLLLIKHIQRIKKDHLILVFQRGLFELNKALTPNRNLEYPLNISILEHPLKWEEKRKLFFFLSKGFRPIEDSNISILKNTSSLQDFVEEYSKMFELTPKMTKQISSIIQKMEEMSDPTDLHDTFITLLSTPTQFSEFFFDNFQHKYKNLTNDEKNQLFLILSKPISFSPHILETIQHSSSLMEFIEKYSESLNLNSEDKMALKNLLITQPVNKKRKGLIFNVMKDSSSFADFRSKYPPIEMLNGVELEKFKSLLRSFIKMSQQEKESYVPTIQDFYKNNGKDFETDRSDKLDSEYLKSVEEISKLVNEIEKKREIKEDIKKDIRKLQTENSSLLAKVNHAIRTINQSFEDALKNPPQELQEEYLEVEQMLLEAEKAFHKFYDQSELSTEVLINGSFPLTSESFHEKMIVTDELQNSYKQFTQTFDTYKEKLNEVKRKYKELAMSGNLGDELKKAFNSIYDGTNAEENLTTIENYKKINELAEMESKFIQYQNELAHLIRDYNHKSPLEAVSDYAPVNLNILGLVPGRPHSVDREEIKRNYSSMKEILSLWKSLNAQTPPEAPPL